MDRLKLKIEEKSTTSVVSVTGVRTRALDNINNLKISVQGTLILTHLQVIDSKDELLLLGNDWFEKVKAQIYIDEQKLIVKYDGKKIKIPITNDKERKVPANETDSNEQSDDEEVDNVLNNIIYEKEDVEEKKGYFSKEARDGSDSNEEACPEELDPAAYLSQIKEP
ncbi:11648_t:CDS:1 [Acaulospora morrowiae]|uniref:11648_t:CDS:1 n=1 Tax=Acaulospora morrowiae TaxID=94023 RepID=A0A9N9FPW7_9GLOM|nr:11648_t:CDS:1 [Acaulospora morrowiae]